MENKYFNKNTLSFETVNCLCGPSMKPNPFLKLSFTILEREENFKKLFLIKILKFLQLTASYFNQLIQPKLQRPVYRTKSRAYLQLWLRPKFITITAIKSHFVVLFKSDLDVQQTNLRLTSKTTRLFLISRESLL